MEFRDYYDTLGVKRSATRDEIKREYRKLARKYHPDVSQETDAEQRFKEIGEAYEVLKDPEKRAAYDRLGANWQAGQDFRPPPDWNQGFEFHGGGFSGGDSADFSDFFETLFGRGFGGHGGREFHARGDNTFARISIDLEDAYSGATRTITLQQSRLGADGRPQVSERTLNVRIPRGVRQGQHIRLGKQGTPGMGQGEAGDLFLEVDFKPHPLYRVDGTDIFIDLPVAPWEAALGASVQVPTPEGRIDLKIPPNSAAGRKLRLQGRGIPARRPGDLYVVLQIVLPRADSEAAKQAYLDLQRATSFDPRAGLGVRS
ncbi:MAG: DnaJ C-terminal domain-containing protein [Gammaproteobacteria bacterium]|nr:DnaJ C-terminal domain-containing protein [Gammaproteobacteria bacterium]